LTQNIILLASEVLILGLLTLLFHAQSRRYGLAPLLIYLSGLVAVLHALGSEAVFMPVLGTSMELSTTTLVPVIFMAVLLLYVLDGTAVTRVTILGIAGLSLLVLGLQAGREAHMLLVETGSDLASSRTLTFTAASLVAFLLGLTAVTIVYQFLANRTPWMPGWVLPGVAMAAGLMLDDLVFRVGTGGFDGFIATLPGGIPAKLAGTLLLWPLATGYLARATAQRTATASGWDRSVLDVVFGTYHRHEADLRTAALRQRESQERLAAIVSGAPLVVFGLDERGVFTLSEGAGLSRLGLEPGEAVGWNAAEAYPPVAGDIRRALGGEEVRGEFRQGDIAFDIVYTPVVEGARVVGVTGVATDVSLRVAAERAGQESRLRFQSTFEQAAVGLLHADLTGNVVLANRAACSMLGRTEEELVGRPVVSLHAEDDQVAVAGVFRDLVSGPGTVKPADARILGGESGPVWVMETVSLVRDEAGAPHFYIVVLEDLTERRITEEQLRQAQKMETVGQLTGGIAHDFNNLLTVVMAGVELAMEDFVDPVERRDALNEALTATERGASLVQRLLAFSRRQPLHPTSVDPAALLMGMEDLLRRTLGETNVLRIETAPDVGLCVADPAQLESAILNLCINARDAMPNGGTLDLRAVRVAVPESENQERRVPAGLYVRITVTDEGVGIDPTVLPRVFEPFFTTKPVGKGSGLGLSMVYGFTRQSEGFVEIESTPGQGTSVHLHFPATADVFH
jgi:PAS domain S-box-containing protein